MTLLQKCIDRNENAMDLSGRQISTALNNNNNNYLELLEKKEALNVGWWLPDFQVTTFRDKAMQWENILSRRDWKMVQNEREHWVEQESEETTNGTGKTVNV